MKLTLKIWRQPRGAQQGKLVEYQIDNISEDTSFLEMLDQLNEELTAAGEEPVAFDSDCREGICGMCGVVINGTAHGRGNSPVPTTTCQLHMRSFNDGDTITIEPWKAQAFPVIKDLVVDRTAMDRFDNATCIGCGACVAACPNASAMLFTSAKITHLGNLPQGQPERFLRIKNMVGQHDSEGFGNCSNIGECAAVCPKGIPLESISALNRDLVWSLFRKDGFTA